MGLGLIAILVLLMAVASALFWPLRGAGGRVAARDRDLGLEIARDAKLGEIHDLELDYRLGKLSDDDYGRLNEELRREAVEIIRQLNSAAGNGGAPGGGRAERRQPE
jgi:hypothetical protein